VQIYLKTNPGRPIHREIGKASFVASQPYCVRIFGPHPSCEAEAGELDFHDDEGPGSPRVMDASTTFAGQQMLATGRFDHPAVSDPYTGKSNDELCHPYGIPAC